MHACSCMVFNLPSAASICSYNDKPLHWILSHVETYLTSMMWSNLLCNCSSIALYIMEYNLYIYTGGHIVNNTVCSTKLDDDLYQRMMWVELCMNIHIDTQKWSLGRVWASPTLVKQCPCDLSIFINCVCIVRHSVNKCPHVLIHWTASIL